MDLQTLLNERNLSKYQLSKLSGVPKTTIMDICAGRSDMERCNAKTAAIWSADCRNFCRSPSKPW